MTVLKNEIISRIIAVNHAWKLSKEQFGNNFPATNSFRDTKSSLQATLLREFSNDAYLMVATDSHDHEEQVYSVRLKHPVTINGVLRSDAEHLPARIAHDIFTIEEIESFLKQ
ncbi:hypothetical protein [Shewanella gaetbuli]|uniref:Uncharacterized protein n=1 Tax=Shewanella gaetbuli TaxID=220752 RepID=A0A9X1ZLK8_9GAMM|nr:hypothetical protein [Shewanella gaetbuli]MCL1143217.1 hypothetical protein [Shewanella gaetbuli]